MTRGADQHVRLDRVNRRKKVRRIVVVRVGQVVRHEIATAFDDQAIDVDKPKATPGDFV
jgi:hypothetical protein